jgi:hypothetical protein
LFIIEGSTRWADHPDNQEPSWSDLTSGLKTVGFQIEKMSDEETIFLKIVARPKVAYKSIESLSSENTLFGIKSTVT